MQLLLTFCLLEAGIIVPGTLQVAGDGDELETQVPGSVTYLCNVSTTASVGDPQQNLDFPGSAGALNVDSASQIVGYVNILAGNEIMNNDTVEEGVETTIPGGSKHCTSWNDCNK